MESIVWGGQTRSISRMRELPLAAPRCSLNETELGEQVDRYRTVGVAATTIESVARRLVIGVADDAPAALIEDLIEVERACCPFLQLEWDTRERRLAIWVAAPEHEPALAAIAGALGGDYG